MARLVTAANRPVAADSVAVFRIAFGLLVAYSSLRFLAKGWVNTLYLDPQHHLTYQGFDWVQPWPAPWMHLHMVALAALGLSIAVGYRHRLAAVLFTLGFVYAELIDAALYLNHYWYVTLVGVLVTVLPVHHRWSLDARAGRVPSSATVPAGVVWALRAQLAMVYIFAGLAKLNPDWLFEALPLRLWLLNHTDLPLVGWLLAMPAAAYVASWLGAIFDTTIVLWLLWPRTRPYAYIAVVGFHLITGMLFPIGVFPWIMIAGGLIFFPPDWPTRILQALFPSETTLKEAPQSTERLRLAQPVVVLLALLTVLEILIPLRHHLYPGNVRWTEEGYYLSWRVMLTEKAGHTEFRVTDPATGRTWIAGPELVLTHWQTTQAAIRPDLLHATAQLIADHYSDRGIPDLEVRADAFVSMNGRPARRMVDPQVDLAGLPRDLRHDEWILTPTPPSEDWRHTG